MSLVSVVIPTSNSAEYIGDRFTSLRDHLRDLKPNYSNFIRSPIMRSPGQALIRRAAILDVGAFDETLSGVDDWDLYIRFSKKYKCLADERIGLYYRFHPNNMNKDTKTMNKLAQKIRKKILQHPPTINAPNPDWAICTHCYVISAKI